MTDQEGVIKFQLEHRRSPALPPDRLGPLIAWRRILYQLQLIGEDPLRYDGFGFGNISQRIANGGNASPRAFIITGTQTGAFPDLGAEHFTTVIECHPEVNRVVSLGPVKPSSEAMTHATLYAIDPGVGAVIHVHSPHIWRAAKALGLPGTPAGIAYGTTAMADAVGVVMSRPATRDLGLFIMGGHEDGVVAFGPSVAQAGSALIGILAQAYQIDPA
jgi:ribulose-5-phosphate 4-epimerase/fuculose-1-phosphate aldolase